MSSRPTEHSRPPRMLATGLSSSALGDLLRARPAGLTVVDCRPDDERDGGRIRGAVSLHKERSMEDLVAAATANPAGPVATYVFYCLAGSATSAELSAQFAQQVRDLGGRADVKVLEGGVFAFVQRYHADPLLVDDFDNDKWGLPLLEPCDDVCSDEAFSSDSGCDTADDDEATQRHASPSPGYRSISVASAAAKSAWAPVSTAPSPSRRSEEAAALRILEVQVAVTDQALRSAKGVVWELQRAARYLHGLSSGNDASSDAVLLKRAKKDLRRIVAQLEQVARRRDDVLSSRWAIRRLSRSLTVFRVSGGGPSQEEKDMLGKHTEILERMCKMAAKMYTRVVMPGANGNAGSEGWPSLVAEGGGVIATTEAVMEKLRSQRDELQARDDEVFDDLVHSTSHRAEEIQILRAVVIELRLLEEDFDFHGHLLSDSRVFAAAASAAGVEAEAGGESKATVTSYSVVEEEEEEEEEEEDGSDDGSNYSSENFAYGSTPFSTWFELMQCTPEITARLVRDSGDKWAVLGSSSGWLVFYAALYNGAKETHGWEVLPSLHMHAEALANNVLAEHRGRTVFHLENALDADLSTFSVVVLAGQCWDDWLLDRVYAKLTAECADGTIIIDYNDRSAHFPQNKAPGDSCGGARLELAAKKILATSWTKSQHFHLWKCVRNAV